MQHKLKILLLYGALKAVRVNVYVPIFFSSQLSLCFYPETERNCTIK